MSRRKKEINLSFRENMEDIETQNDLIFAMEPEVYVNKETGEEVQAITLLLNPKNFDKIFLEDFAKIMRLVGNNETKVFTYILENTIFYDDTIPIEKANLFIGSYEEIAKGAKVSKSTVQRTIDKLVGSMAMVKLSNKTYRINPNLISVGKAQQQHVAMHEFNDEVIRNLSNGESLDRLEKIFSEELKEAQEKTKKEKEAAEDRKMKRLYEAQRKANRINLQEEVEF